MTPIYKRSPILSDPVIKAFDKIREAITNPRMIAMEIMIVFQGIFLFIVSLLA